MLLQREPHALRASQCCTCEDSVAVWKSVLAGQEGATGIWGGIGRHSRPAGVLVRQEGRGTGPP